MIKNRILIYDFDGVICDSVNMKTQGFIDLYKNHENSIIESIVNYHLKFGGLSRIKKIEYIQKEILKNPISPSEINDLADEFSKLVKEKVANSSYIKGVKNFLEVHSLDSSQFICTGTPEREIHEIIKIREIDHLFDGIFGSPDSKSSIVNKILKNNRNKECFFFGDTMTDYLAAQECSISFVGLRNRYTQFPPNSFVIDDFLDPKLNLLGL